MRNLTPKIHKLLIPCNRTKRNNEQAKVIYRKAQGKDGRKERMSKERREGKKFKRKKMNPQKIIINRIN
jgi:hypothetical protein